MALKLFQDLSKTSEGLTVDSINKYLAELADEDLGMVEMPDSPSVALFNRNKAV